MLVSVVMPVFNGIEFLRESIDSILEQSHSDLKFIILDDGSTEPVWDLIQSYNDARIVAFKNSKNIGLTKSLNICLDKVRGDFVARFDSDDISSPNRIEKQLECFESGVGFVSCWYNLLVKINNNWKPKSNAVRYKVSTKDLSKRYTEVNWVNDPGTIYSIKAIRKIGYFDERLYLGQTYNYNRRIQQFFSGRIIQEFLYLKRQWSGKVGLRARKLHPEYWKINWCALCNKYAEANPIIFEREKHLWES